MVPSAAALRCLQRAHTIRMLPGVMGVHSAFFVPGDLDHCPWHLNSSERGPNTSSLWIWCKSVQLLPEISDSQKISLMRDWRSTPLEWLSSARDLDLDLGLGHTAYCCVSLIELYLHIENWNRKNFVVDGLSAGTPPSSRSHDTKSRKNIKHPARSILDIVL